MTGEDESDGLSSTTKKLIALAAVLLLIPVLLVGASVVSFVVGLGPASGEVPQAAFSVQVDDQVRIVHEDGVAIDAANLYVHYDGAQAGSWASLSGGGGDVSAGDSVAVPDAERGDVIDLVFESEAVSGIVQSVEVEATPVA